MQGSGELSPIGLLSAVRFIAAFSTVSQVLHASAVVSKRQQQHQIARTNLLASARKEGIVALVSAVLLPLVSN